MQQCWSTQSASGPAHPQEQCTGGSKAGLTTASVVEANLQRKGKRNERANQVLLEGRKVPRTFHATSAVPPAFHTVPVGISGRSVPRMPWRAWVVLT